VQTSLFVLKLVAALGCGVIGGVFFGFSTFVMRALGSGFHRARRSRRLGGLRRKLDLLESRAHRRRRRRGGGLHARPPRVRRCSFTLIHR
jgi:hypothetical protein